MSIRDIFLEMIKEAKDGKILIGDEPYNIRFNTRLEDKEYLDDINYPCLIVSDENEFYDKLANYVDIAMDNEELEFLSEKEKVKTIMMYLFVNASIKDFSNPVEYIERRINYYLDDKMSKEKEVSTDLLNCDLLINRVKGSVYMETPYKMTFTLKKDGEIATLPSIYYGIDGSTCYIYSIMNKNKDNSNLAKKVNRELYKLNEGIYDSEGEEYKEFKEGLSSYYPENISDVTPSFVFTTMLFLRELERNNITNIKLVTELPIRYNARDDYAEEHKKEELKERNDRIQNNSTNKFIRTFMRCMYHLDGLVILNYPFEEDEYMGLKIVDEIKIKDISKKNVK